MNLIKFLSKYKVFLLLFFLFFTVNVKADTVYTIAYSDDTISFIENNNEMLESFDTWLNNQGKIVLYNNLGNASSYYLTQYYFYYLDVSKYNNNHHFQVVGFPIVGQTLNSTMQFNMNNNFYFFSYFNSTSSEVVYNENDNSFSWVSTNKEYSSSTNYNYYSNSSLVDNVIEIKYIYNNSHGIQEQSYSTLTLTTNNNNDLLQIGTQTYVTNDRIDIYDFVDSLNAQLSTVPQILQPEINYYNGYSSIKFLASNYTTETIEDYNIIIENVTNGTIEYIQPVLSSNEQSELTITVYESTTFHYYLLDINSEEILEEYYTSVNINYSEEQDFYINVNNIDNQNKTINYSYIKNQNNTINNYSCYHQIYNQPKVEDINCNLNNNSFTLNVGSNTSVNFFIYDSNNNLIYTNQQNFIFNLGNTYITFDENYINNFVNLNVIIHKYNQNQVVKYSIDNSSEFEAILYNMNTYDNSYFFNINNLNKNQVIRINVYENNIIVASAEYKINIYRNIDAWQSSNDLKSFFNSLNINNISDELKNLIKQFGELILNSRLGNLILLQFFIISIILILKLIRK